MKKLITKIRNKKLKGNVSLLVIFVLLATSVISLLSINQIQRLLTYGNMTFNYFRAFYLAKAGNELGLTEVYNSGDGFNHAISGDNSIIQNNLVGVYTGFDPYFDMTITGSFSTLTKDVRYSECEKGSGIWLETGAGIMLSLFSDITDDLDEILTGGIKPDKLENYDNLELNLKSNTPELTFALFTYDSDDEENESMKDIVVHTGTSLSNFFYMEDVESFMNSYRNDNKKYLTIKNSGNSPVEFCVEMDGNQLIPYSDFLITVFGHYGDMEVGLQSIVKKGVPDWTLNVLDQVSPS